MKIEFSTENNNINSLLDEVKQVVEELDPDDKPVIDCGFLAIEVIGDLLHDFYGYWFGSH